MKKQISPHDRTRQRQDGAERIQKDTIVRELSRAESGSGNAPGVSPRLGNDNVHNSARGPISKKVPVFSNEEMLSVAARALAKTFKKPRKKYSR